MIGWRNKDTGVFHAHAVRTGGDIQFTGCGRFRVIADDELRRAVEHALYWLVEDA